MSPRGLADNNPGNLRAVADLEWRGQIGVDEHGFVRFDSAANGLRALARTLFEYRDRHHLDTVRGIVSRWAPPADGNDTEAYIADVAHRLGIGPDASIDFANPSMFPSLIAAIVRHEQGEQPFSDDTIVAAIAAAQPEVAPVSAT